MKNLISFITLLIFIHSNTNYVFRAWSDLFDADMEHLVAGTPYFIVPVRSDQGGGLYWYGTNTTCYAVQQPIDDLPSQVVIFNHDKSQVGDWLSPSTDLNIRFEYFFGCDSSSLSLSPSSGVLQVDNYDEATGKHFITTGGVEGNPGCGTITNWFQIERIIGEYSYKLVYCPSVCDLVNVITSRDVGGFAGGAFPRLVLSDYPVLVRFQKEHRCGSHKV